MQIDSRSLQRYAPLDADQLGHQRLNGLSQEIRGGSKEIPARPIGCVAVRIIAGHDLRSWQTGLSGDAGTFYVKVNVGREYSSSWKLAQKTRAIDFNGNQMWPTNLLWNSDLLHFEVFDEDEVMTLEVMTEDSSGEIDRSAMSPLLGHSPESSSSAVAARETSRASSGSSSREISVASIKVPVSKLIANDGKKVLFQEDLVGVPISASVGRLEFEASFRMYDSSWCATLKDCFRFHKKSTANGTLLSSPRSVRFQGVPTCDEGEASEDRLDALPSDLLDSEIKRNVFIKKMYAILSMQIIVAILLAMPFHLMHDLKVFVTSTPSLIYVAWAAALMLIVLMTCCAGKVQTYPYKSRYNYAFLFAITIVEACIIGFYTAKNDTLAIIIATAVTCLICIVLSIYADYISLVRTNFTGWSIYLLVASVAVVSMGSIALVIGLAWNWTGMMVLGVVPISFYLVYHTQIIVAGRHPQHAFKVDDYVLGALCLYSDVISLPFILWAGDSQYCQHEYDVDMGVPKTIRKMFSQMKPEALTEYRNQLAQGIKYSAIRTLPKGTDTIPCILKLDQDEEDGNQMGILLESNSRKFLIKWKDIKEITPGKNLHFISVDIPLDDLCGTIVFQNKKTLDCVSFSFETAAARDRFIIGMNGCLSHYNHAIDKKSEGDNCEVKWSFDLGPVPAEGEDKMSVSLTCATMASPASDQKTNLVVRLALQNEEAAQPFENILRWVIARWQEVHPKLLEWNMQARLRVTQEGGIVVLTVNMDTLTGRDAQQMHFFFDCLSQIQVTLGFGGSFDDCAERPERSFLKSLKRVSLALDLLVSGNGRDSVTKDMKRKKLKQMLKAALSLLTGVKVAFNVGYDDAAVTDVLSSFGLTEELLTTARCQRMLGESIKVMLESYESEERVKYESILKSAQSLMRMVHQIDSFTLESLVPNAQVTISFKNFNPCILVAEVLQFTDEPSKSTLESTKLVSAVKPEEEKDFLRNIFTKYDKNSDGTLDAQELLLMCSELGVKVSEEEAKEAMKRLDQDGNGVCDFEEFIKFWSSQPLVGRGGYSFVLAALKLKIIGEKLALTFQPEDKEFLQGIFKTYDKDRDGSLDVQELLLMCSELGVEVSEEEAKAAMTHLDRDGNKVCDFDEFLKFWSGHPLVGDGYHSAVLSALKLKMAAESSTSLLTEVAPKNLGRLQEEASLFLRTTQGDKPKLTERKLLADASSPSGFRKFSGIELQGSLDLVPKSPALLWPFMAGVLLPCRLPPTSANPVDATMKIAVTLCKGNSVGREKRTIATLRLASTGHHDAAKCVQNVEKLITQTLNVVGSTHIEWSVVQDKLQTVVRFNTNILHEIGPLSQALGIVVSALQHITVSVSTGGSINKMVASPGLSIVETLRNISVAADAFILPQGKAFFAEQMSSQDKVFDWDVAIRKAFLWLLQSVRVELQLGYNEDLLQQVLKTLTEASEEFESNLKKYFTPNGWQEIVEDKMVKEYKKRQTQPKEKGSSKDWRNILETCKETLPFIQRVDSFTAENLPGGAEIRVSFQNFNPFVLLAHFLQYASVVGQVKKSCGRVTKACL